MEVFEDIEKTILNICLIDNKNIDYITSYIKPEYFENLLGKEIFYAILELKNNNEPIDLYAIARKIKKEDNFYYQIVDQFEFTPGYSNRYLNRYIDIFLDKYKGKLLKDYALGKDLTQESIEDLSKQLKGLTTNKNQSISLDESILLTAEYLQEIGDKTYPTLIKSLDYLVKIRSTNLIVLAGRPKSGKTTLALNFAYSFAKQGFKVLFFTFEMSKYEIVQKILAIITKQTIKNIDDMVNISKIKEIYNVPLDIIESSGLTVEEMKAQINKIEPDIIFIDQLDCIPVNTSLYRHDLMIGENVMKLKSLSMEFKKPIILLHQLNREAEKINKPSVTSLKDSGLVEQKADVVLQLYREMEEDFKLKAITLYVTANRMGILGSVPLKLSNNGQIFLEKEIDLGLSNSD